MKAGRDAFSLMGGRPVDGFGSVNPYRCPKCGPFWRPITFMGLYSCPDCHGLDWDQTTDYNPPFTVVRRSTITLHRSAA